MSYSCKVYVDLMYIEAFYSAPCFLHVFMNFYIFIIAPISSVAR